MAPDPTYTFVEVSVCYASVMYLFSEFLILNTLLTCSLLHVEDMYCLLHVLIQFSKLIIYLIKMVKRLKHAKNRYLLHCTKNNQGDNLQRRHVNTIQQV